MILTYFPERILVLGATGFVGERVCRRLRRAGVEVVALTRTPHSPVAEGLHLAGCEIAEGDCTRRWTLWQAMEGCTAVVSCAHIRYAEVVLQGCNRTGIARLLCMSSTRRFSKVRDHSVEECIRGEFLLSQSELEYTVVRPTMIYGSTRDRNIYPIMQWMRRRPWFPVFGPGLASVQPVFVEDVVTALMDVLRRPDTIGKSYTLAGAEPMTWNGMIGEIAAALDREVRILHFPVSVGLAGAKLGGRLAARKGLTRESILRMQEPKEFDIAEAQETLGFAPRLFRVALQQMVVGESETDAIYGPPGGDRWSDTRVNLKLGLTEAGAGASRSQSPAEPD
ncbi:MAG: hypothetical protein PWP23_529 [Candidatus Sumerlaeota bacterium]|nr:hypothetical protein [Candidatus Sumerlaeota bacterium]